ncbi:MAG: FAD-linked oxidase C-terminal domain-containing protein [Opitutales bacterium]|jgi:glycolate oxidase|nr:FAD-linked oxidase C-terminal domain-containing protein [Opitutales bacterium]
MDLINQLEQLFPPKQLFTKKSQLVAYETDGLTSFRSEPLAVVVPETHDQVIETVRLCHKAGVPFMARGSGTSLSGGSMPVEGGVVITLNRLNKILKLDPENRFAVVEAGTVNLKVSQAAAPHRLYYAPDPSSQQICTIGGNLAFNSGGAHCLKYGMTANHVLGIKAVLADGEVVELGGESADTVGPDAAGFFCGNEGLFGVALEVTLRLTPQPQRYCTLLAAYDSLEKAGHAVSAVVDSGMLPGAMEIMDKLSIKAAETAVNAGYPQDAAALLIVELEGEIEAVEEDFKTLRGLIDTTGAYETRVAQDDAERMTIWKGRKSAFSAVGRLSPDYLVQDGVVPRSRLAEALVKIENYSKEYGLDVANVFHAGDGNLHPLIMFNGKEEGALHHAEELAGKILSMCVEMGGSITGEHGVGMEKKKYMPQMFNETDMECMKRVRRAIDPLEIANRGKMFPGGEAPALTTHGAHPLEKAGIISRE